MIGVDPRKASHTAVAVSAAEEPLGELRVRACVARAERLLAWAQAWPRRTWAVGGRAARATCWPGRQLLPAGERVLDVQPEPGARVRLLAAGTGTRTTSATPARWPSRRCGQPASARCGPVITRRC